MEEQNIKVEQIVDLYVSDNVTDIDEGKYFGLTKLKSVHLGPNVRVVHQGAFSSCPNLEYIECTNNTKFENYVFNNDPKISTFKCGSNTFKVVCLPSHAFYLGLLQEQVKNQRLYKGGFCSENKLGQASGMSHVVTYLGAVTQGDKEYTWFGDTPELACVAAKYKASHKSFTDYFHCTLNEDSIIGWGQLELLIGVCHSGFSLWAATCNHYGYDIQQGLPIKVIAEVFQEFFPILYSRLVEALANQDRVFHWLDYEKLYSGLLFVKEYTQFIQAHPDWAV